jgi:hypothetical protein
LREFVPELGEDPLADPLRGLSERLAGQVVTILVRSFANGRR